MKLQKQSEKCKENGLRYLDAPVSGGEKGAQNASLAIMVGGDAQTFSHAEHVLSAMGRPILVGGWLWNAGKTRQSNDSRIYYCNRE